MPSSSLKGLDAATAEALIGIDTLWGGDVMNPSGTGRFIADCWFSDEPLPAAYTHPAAAALRANGGVGAKAPDKASIEAYVAAVDVKGAIKSVISGSRALGGVFGAALRLFSWYREDNIRMPFYGNDAVSQGVSILFFVGLCLYLWFDSTRKVREA